ncbi:MAG TPA: hypothetical protein VK488_12735 [Gaiellaceae bacterium]|nr:hypothetical protein [Gaiellaceae bacterium]
MYPNVLNKAGKRFAVTVGIVAAGLAAYATPGVGAPDRHARGAEYPLSVIAVQTEPQRPKAGKPFTAMIGIVNEETGGVVQSGDVTCPARIGQHAARVIDKGFIDGGGIAMCTWMVPRKAGGKRMVAKVEVYSDEGTVRSRFLRVVRR